VEVSSDKATALFEWGPNIAPPPAPIHLTVGYTKKCEGLNLGIASGFVATNYGRAYTWTGSKDNRAPVKTLKVSIVYDSPAFPLTRNPTQTVNDQSYAETAEQLRSFGLGWNAEEICRGYKVVGEVETLDGKHLRGEIHTK
jgi:hypothetical protein